MIKSVSVFCKAQMKDFIKAGIQSKIDSGKVAVISIVETSAEKLFPGDPGILSLCIDDISPKSAHQYNWSSDDKISAMTFHQGFQIVKFIESINDKPDDIELYVHCSAGISRSGAVGLFATQYLSLDEKEFYENNSQILPNSWIENVLWSVVSNCE